MPYFTQLAQGTDPDARDLHNFMDAARRFLHDLLAEQLQLGHPQPDTAPALFENLRHDTLAVFLDYVHDRFQQLQAELDSIDETVLAAHGLTGERLHRQLRTLADLEASTGGAQAYWPRVGKILQELDTTLDTVLDPLSTFAPRFGGFIGLFKEFRAPVINLVNG
ncbi:hypothetical protein CR159_02040 [Pollutimonas subterranea]|uniref:Uncharacterized protein n=1 Tax=Pollutimonas subterranea TaxID=2045210 RepID=A0A2N4U9X5_9BURK|nr:hypothetical protein [Pollutimonas subterranea]PLC51824.1 hypothetical protein CR159_02040 [Pollutimonas subterranea]